MKTHMKTKKFIFILVLILNFGLHLGILPEHLSWGNDMRAALTKLAEQEHCNKLLTYSLIKTDVKNQTQLKTPLRAIISGGQTGADRAALDAAIELGIPIGGWIASGRIAFDGLLDSKRYPLIETKSYGYYERSVLNAFDADGSLAITFNGVEGGTGWTEEASKALGKAFFVVKIQDGQPEKYFKKIATWIKKNKITVLNVAGPSAPAMYNPAKNFMIGLIEYLNK